MANNTNNCEYKVTLVQYHYASCDILQIIQHFLRCSVYIHEQYKCHLYTWKAQDILTHLAQKSWHTENILGTGKHNNDTRLLLRSHYQQHFVENNFTNTKCIRMVCLFFLLLWLIFFLKISIYRIKKKTPTNQTTVTVWWNKKNP